MQNQPPQEKLDAMGVSQPRIENDDGMTGDTSADSSRRGLGIEINFARINTVRDIREILHELQAAAAHPRTSEGSPSPEATQQLAAMLGMVADDLVRQRGGDLLAGEALAAARLLVLSGNRLLDAARRAAAAHATPGALFVFRRMLTVHSAFEAVARGAEAGVDRALLAWKMPFGNGAEHTAGIGAALDRAGGRQIAAQLATRFLALLRSSADGAALNQAVRQAAFVATVDDLRAFWINGLLAAPPEMVALTAARTDRLMRSCVEAGLAGRIARQRGGAGVSTDAAAAVLFAIVGGLADAFVLATRNISHLPGLPHGVARVDLARGGGVLRVFDFLDRPLALQAQLGDGESGVLKALGYRMNLRSEAYRRAANGDGVSGNDVASLIVDPPADLHLAAIDADSYAVLADAKAVANGALRRIRDAGGASSALLFLVPLLQEPEAIGRSSLDGTHFAPLAACWRGEIGVGGPRRDLALAQAATAAAILAIATFSPLSVADRSLSDPIDQIATFAAACNSIIASGEIDPDDVPRWNSALAGAVLAVAQLCASRSFLQRFAQRVAGADDATAEPKAVPDLPAGTPLRVVVDQLAPLAARMTARLSLWGNLPDAESSRIDEEILHQGADATLVEKKTDFAGAAVNFRDWPAVYEEYRRLAGNELKHPEHGLGARDFLDAVVRGNSPMSRAYRRMSDGPDGSKAVFIRHTIGSYRRMAQQKILGDRRFRDFAAYVQRVKALKDNPRSGESS
jgi:hypothetical protein